MIGRNRLAALAALAVFGCSEPAPPPASGPRVSLSSDRPDANAGAIAAFFRQTCLDASGETETFAAALRNSGWDPEQVQAASSVIPIAAWRLGNGEIVRSAVSLGPGTTFIDCELRLDADVSPSLERMRDTLRPLVSQPTLREISAGPPQVKWQWRPSPLEERDLRIEFITEGRRGGAAAGRPSLSIHFGSAQAPPPPALPAVTDNVQLPPAEPGNVQ